MTHVKFVPLLHVTSCECIGAELFHEMRSNLKLKL